MSDGRSTKRGPWYTTLYLQVIVAIALGILVGHFCPEFGIALKPLGDAFIALIKMMIGPVVFCIVVEGIASMPDLKKVGRVGIKALVYFEVLSTFALIVGLLVAHLVRPGSGLNIDPSTLDPKAVSNFTAHVKGVGIGGLLSSIIPET